MSIPDTIRDKEFDQLRARLLKLAGYTDVEVRQDRYPITTNAKIHMEFRDILSVLEEIAARKVDGYGPFRYDELENNWRWEIQALYQDIERKFGRLKTLCRPNPVGPDQSNAILEILGDLAVYSARGIQIILRLEQFAKTPGGLLHGETHDRKIIERTDHRSE